MSKTISVELSKSGIRKAKSELDSYIRELNKKNAIFVDRLAELGMQNINVIMQGVPREDEAGTWNVQIDQTSTRGIANATVTLSGTQILFIEFGTGIKYTSPEHPQKAERGYYAGSFGKGQGRNPRGWYYRDRAGLKRHTYGNIAHMPMYYSSIRMKTNIAKIAREVFGN